MNQESDLESLLQLVRDRKVDPTAAAVQIRSSIEHDLGFAKIDHHRPHRRGFPEAIFCEGKSLLHIESISKSFLDNNAKALFTRVRPEHEQVILSVLPDAELHPDAAMISWSPRPEEAIGKTVVVLSAGTSDYMVAAEAIVTCRFLGRQVVPLADVGVAGLHRLLRRLDVLKQAGCIVVVAGMDGALASVVAGLVSCPVVAVPTSVGYGAAFNGITALLSMMMACSPGVGVVNIDNGFGAGYLAAQITT